MYKNLYKPLVTLTFFLALIGINNANAATIAVPVSVKVVSALTVTKGDDIHFGTIHASGSISGKHTLVLNHDGGEVTPSKTNKITILKGKSSTAGSITVSGEGAAVVTILAVVSEEISNGANKAAYSLDPAVSEHVANGGEYTLDADGEATISLGGKVEFDGHPATGTYTANITFTVSY